MMAKLGAFDMPQGAGNSGGNGRSGASIHTTAFGSGSFGEGGTGAGGGTGSAGALKVGVFGEQQAARNQPALAQGTPATSPVVILYKPKPAYSAEAEHLHLEGEAALEVVFSAAGTVRVVRVVHGLGHGLDQEAERAATEIRFRPATRGGSPVDTTAMVRILFQLT